MSIIFIESAASYAGRASSAVGIRTAFLRGITNGRNAVTVDSKYTIVNDGVLNKGGFTLLKNYDFQLSGEDATSGCIFNGKTKVTPLKNCLGQMAEVDTPGNFCIINANSAHHFSYELSRRAFYSQIRSEGAMGRKKVVINIDNHVDYGKYVRDKPRNQENIDCGRWGGHHLGFWSVHCTGGAEYVSLRCGEKLKTTDRNMIHSVRGGGQSTVTVEKLPDNPTRIIERLRRYDSDTHDVYLTVDRDFMLNNGTKYLNRGCLHNNRNGMEFVENCINAIKRNCTIIAADITGMPTNGDRKGARCPAGYDEDAPGQIDLAINDVKNMASLL